MTRAEDPLPPADWRDVGAYAPAPTDKVSVAGDRLTTSGPFCGLQQETVQTAGQVPVTGLLAYLSELEKGVGPSQEARRIQWEAALADAAAKNQSNLAAYNAQNAHAIEMFKSVMDAGKEALNALLLINGGAVVAILGFLGTAFSKDRFSPQLGLSLTYPLAYFGLGVLAGALAFGIRYVAQACFAGEWKKWGMAFNVLSILAGLGGYAAFGLGLAGAHGAFQQLFLGMN